jgi:hypothetical protein
MKLLLQLQTASDVSAVLNAAYAFAPAYSFTHTGNGVLVTTLDAATDLTPAQIAILQGAKYNVSFELPVAPATPVVAPVPASPPVVAPSA